MLVKPISYKYSMSVILLAFSPILLSFEDITMHYSVNYAYPIEFFQQLNTSGLFPTLLCLEVGYSVILLKNLDPGKEVCIGTRLIFLNIRRKML